MKIYFEKVSELFQNSPQVFDEWYNDVAYDKRERIDRITDTSRRNTLILSDHLARKAVSEFCNIPEKDVVFRYNSHGKPFYPLDCVHFSVSHSGNYVVCCIDENPCGIDIETLRDVQLKTAKRFCTENELEFINSADDKRTAFLYIWTRKEAYFKSLGCGIATILRAVDVLKTDGFETVIENGYIISTFKSELH